MSRTLLAVTAASVLLACSDATAPLRSSADGALDLLLTSGERQHGALGTTLADPVTVRVVDRRGRGVPGVSVGFTVTAGDGRLDPARVLTDETGAARARWTLSVEPGEQRGRATVEGRPAAEVSFTAVSSREAVRYVSFPVHDGRGDALSLYPWYGEHVVLLVPELERDPATMAALLETFDRAWEYAHALTGRWPTPYPPTVLNGRATIAIVTRTCGAGCGYLGFTGIEIMQPYFDDLYENVRLRNEYGNLVFWEIGRNFWFYERRLDGPADVRLNATTGFAVLMTSLIERALGLAVTPIEAERQRVITDAVRVYLADPAWDWSRVVAEGRAPWENGTTIDGIHLWASLVLHLSLRLGGDEFLQGFLAELARRPVAQRTQDTIDSFVLAASAGAGSNLTCIFRQVYRFDLSTEAVQEAETRFGAPLTRHDEEQQAMRSCA